MPTVALHCRSIVTLTLALAAFATPALADGGSLEKTITSRVTIGGDAAKPSSENDWPIHSRLLELMDNRDGTLSIFGTVVDHGAALVTPKRGSRARGFGRETLASLGREFSFNDPQVGGGAKAEGRRNDRNVELLLPDPRR